MGGDLVSIVVPLRDDLEGVTQLLASVPPSDYGGIEVVLNQDPRATTELEPVVAPFVQDGLTVLVLHSNLSRAQGRLEGAKQASGGILLHLDSDMELRPGLVAEIRHVIQGGQDAVVLPEVCVGTGFWARCKALEKQCWMGDQDVEAARAFRTGTYWEVGGHDPSMIWSEDKDLDLRIRRVTPRVVSSVTPLTHNERRLTFRTAVSKKAKYAKTAKLFAAKHPRSFRRQRSPMRILVLLWRSWRISRDPRLVAGVIFLKSSEFVVGGLSMIRPEPQEGSEGG